MGKSSINGPFSMAMLNNQREIEDSQHPESGSIWISCVSTSSHLEEVAEPHPAGRCSCADPFSSCHPGRNDAKRWVG